jgi:hypothetical protein
MEALGVDVVDESKHPLQGVQVGASAKLAGDAQALGVDRVRRAFPTGSIRILALAAAGVVGDVVFALGVVPLGVRAFVRLDSGLRASWDLV